MRVAICGGGGFIGCAVVDRLLEDRHDLRVLERSRVEPHRQFLASEKIEWLTGDLMSVHDANSAIDGAEAVVRFVSTTFPASSSDDPILDPEQGGAGSIPRELGRRGHPQGLRAHQRCHRGVCAAPSTIVADTRSSTSLPGSRVSLNGLLNLTGRVLGREVARIYHPGRPLDAPVSVLGAFSS